MDPSSPTDAAAAPSRHLGRYELVHLLGQGGMGEVFLAKISGAAGFEKPCIVKTVLPALLKDGQFVDRFHHEARVLVHLVHSSIAQVYDMGEADGLYYMALEYVAGVDLAYLQERARAAGTRLPVPVALYLGQHVCEGLGYAHRKLGPDGQPLGIVHRDVSPHNVMVSYEGEVKVIDFGLAKSAARSKYTLPATVMGKLGYMCPEQVRAEPVDHRGDIYSCGVVVWELLAGQPLVPHGTVAEMMAAMSNPVVPSLCELRPDVSPELDAVVRRALGAHPDERYARADDFARALGEQLLRGGSSLGAEEVGDFVRTLCPEAFASQRKLVSQLTSAPGSRRPSSPPMSPQTPPIVEGAVVPVNTGVLEAPGTGELAFASTLVRTPSGPSVAPAAAVVVAGDSRGPGRKGWTVAIALGALGLIGASAGVTAVLMNQPEDRGPPPEWGSRDRPPPHELSGPPPMMGMGPPPGMPPGPPPGMPPGPPPPFPEELAARPLPAVEPAAEPPGGDPRGAVRPSRVVAAPNVVAMRRGPRHSYVLPVEGTEGLSPGMVLPVVVPPVRDGKAKYLGEATVMQVSARGVLVTPDASVRAAGRTERFAVLPDVVPAKFSVPETPSAQAAPVPPPAPAPAPAPETPAAPATPRELSGRIAQRNLGPFRTKFELTNTDSVTWSGCLLVVRGREMYKLGGIAPGGTREVSLNDFVAGGREVPFVQQNRLGLFCKEGERLFPVKL